MLLAAIAAVVLAGACAAGLASTSGDGGQSSSGPLAARSLGLSAALAVSRGLGQDLPGYGAVRSGSGFAVASPRTRLRASFAAGGATVSAAGGSVRIGLASVDGAAAPAARPSLSGGLVEYARGGVREWFASGPAGIEQGFTVPADPAAGSAGRLELSLAVSGLLARPGPGGAIVLSRPGGAGVVGYSELTVSDARGRELPASMSVAPGGIAIHIDANGAIYPLNVDPLLNKVGELYASDGVKEAFLGESVAASGGTVVVGTTRALVGGVKSGAAYVFAEGAGGWATATQSAKLVPAHPENEELFGRSVAVSGNTVVVGATGKAGAGGYGAGSAYVYVEPGGGWSSVPVEKQTTELFNTEDVAAYEFGRSVAISGETIVVGSPQYRDYVQNESTPAAAGAAFVVIRPAAGWSADGTRASQTAVLDVHEKEAEGTIGHMGESVAIAERGSVQTIAVGAPGEPVGTEAKYRRGTVYLFRRPDEGWSAAKVRERFPEGTLIASGSSEYSELGSSLSAAGRFIAAGAEHQAVAAVDQGAGYVFTEPSGGWTEAHELTQAAELVSPGGSEFDEYGKSIAVEGSTVAVGGLAKAVYLFAMPKGGWSGEEHPTAEFTDGSPAGETGIWSATISGGEVYAGRLASSPPAEGGPQDAGAVDVSPFAPVVTTGAAGPVAETSATATGTVNPDQTEVTSCTIEYGPTTSYGQEVPCGSFPKTGVTTTAVSAPLTGLSAAKGYHYRVVAANTVDTTYGEDATVTTAGTPLVTTGAPSGVSETSATVTGMVNPKETEVTSCVFQYGASTSYGLEVPCGSFPSTGTSASPVSAVLTGLAAGSSYHYRVVVSDGLELVYGADATVTTGVVAAKTEPAPTTTETPKSTVTTTTTTTPITAVLACGTQQVALIDVVPHGSKVLITGAARLVLAGRTVSIRFLATGKVVATARIEADGAFSTTAPLPPARIRETNAARYEAVLGSLRSLPLKLFRRMYMTSARYSGSHVVLSGYVTGSFRAGTVVRILLRVTCRSEHVVASTKLTRSGRFTVTVPAPTGAASQIAVYRGSTSVLDNGHPEPTYTLPTPPGG